MKRIALTAIALVIVSAIGCGADHEDINTHSETLEDSRDSQQFVAGGDITPQEAVRCREVAAPPAACEAAPNLSVVHAVLRNAGSIEVVATGDTCAETVTGFGFRVFNADGQDITGRSWPELTSIETHADTFTLRGDAAGCSDYRGATQLEVFAITADEYSNSIRVEIDRSQFTE
jgi:hypothetical protein